MNDKKHILYKKFNVTITETLKMVVEVEAQNQQQAEQIVSDRWRNSEYILDADNFCEVSLQPQKITNVKKIEVIKEIAYT